MIIGPPGYLTEVGFNCVKPVQPPTTHPPAIAKGTTAQIRTWETNNNLQWRDWAVFRRFKRGICETSEIPWT